MTRYRFSLDKEVVRYASRALEAIDRYVWDNEATLVGDEDVVADALRALADKIDTRTKGDKQ